MNRTWKCKACGHTVQWSYEDLAENGNPICGQPDCQREGQDMDLLPGPAGADGVFVRFECGSEDRIGREHGPFPFVQLTYDVLRTGHDGQEFAHIDGADGFWRVGDNQEKWSDVVIATAAPPALAIQPPPGDQGWPGEPLYRVIYQIDLHARSRREAAREAWETLKESTGPVFQVIDHEGNVAAEDLEIWQEGDPQPNH